MRVRTPLSSITVRVNNRRSRSCVIPCTLIASLSASPFADPSWVAIGRIRVFPVSFHCTRWYAVTPRASHQSSVPIPSSPVRSNGAPFPSCCCQLVPVLSSSCPGVSCYQSRPLSPPPPADKIYFVIVYLVYICTSPFPVSRSLYGMIIPPRL